MSIYDGIDVVGPGKPRPQGQVTESPSTVKQGVPKSGERKRPMDHVDVKRSGGPELLPDPRYNKIKEVNKENPGSAGEVDPILLEPEMKTNTVRPRWKYLPDNVQKPASKSQGEIRGSTNDRQDLPMKGLKSLILDSFIQFFNRKEKKEEEKTQTDYKPSCNVKKENGNTRIEYENNDL